MTNETDTLRAVIHTRVGRRVLLDELARILRDFDPRGTSVELVAHDRRAIREQLGEHLSRELGLDADEEERFYLAVTAPYRAERVSHEATS